MCKAKILSNLKGRVNFVSGFCATSGIDEGAFTALNELVKEGLVEKQMVHQDVKDKFGRPWPPVPMYRAYPRLDTLTLVK